MGIDHAYRKRRVPSVTSWSGGKFNDRRDALREKYRTSIDQAFMRVPTYLHA